MRSKANDALARLRELNGVTSVQADSQSETRRLEVKVDRDAVARFGLSPSDLLETIRIATGERVVTQVRDGNRKFDVVLKTSRGAGDPKNVGQYRIRLRTGELVPLSQLATVQMQAAPGVVYREDLQPVVSISYHIGDRDASAVQADIQNALGPIKQSLNAHKGGYRIEYRPE